MRSHEHYHHTMNSMKYHVDGELLAVLMEHGVGSLKPKSTFFALKTSIAVVNNTSALVGTPWEVLDKTRKANVRGRGKLPPRVENNSAPQPPAQLPRPIKIIWDGAVYEGIPQNDANSSKSSKPFFLNDGVSYQGWLNFTDGAYDYQTLNNSGEGGILMYPCTREQGRKGGFIDKSRVYNAEYKPWFMFGIDKTTGLPTLNCCRSNHRKKHAATEDGDGDEDGDEDKDAPDEKKTKGTGKEIHVDRKNVQIHVKKGQNTGFSERTEETMVTDTEVESTSRELDVDTGMTDGDEESFQAGEYIIESEDA